MGKETIFINNIAITNVHLTESLGNLIVCSSIKEEFFGISSLLIEGKLILCEHLDSNIVKCNVRVDNTLYENVPFIFVVDKNATNRVAINKATLTSPKLFVESKEEPTQLVEKVLPNQQYNIEFENALSRVEEKNKTIANLEKELQLVKEEAKKEKIITEKVVETQLQKKIDKGIEEYKQKLFESFFVLSEEQNRLKDVLVENTLNDLKSVFDKKYIKEVSEIRDTSIKEVREYTKEFLHKLSRKLNSQSTSNLNEIHETVNNTLKSDLFLVTEELQNRFNKQVDTNKQELYTKLESHKNLVKKEIIGLFENYEVLNKIETDKKLDKKIVETKDALINKYIEDIERNNNALKQEFHQHFDQLDQKINKKRVEQIKFDSNELVAEAARLLIEEDDRTTGKLKKFKEQLLKELQKAAKTYTEQANKRMMRYAEMMSGGGSVAKQFAGGGTMDGDLNVTGTYLSGGKDLGSSIVTLVYEALFGGGGGGGGGGEEFPALNVDNWNSVYTTVNTYSAEWFGGPEQGIQNITYNVVNETLSIEDGNTVSLSALSYRNIEAPDAQTIEEFASTFLGIIHRGYTVTLSNGRVYTFAGTDKNNPTQYLELNANPITPIYKETPLNLNEVEVDFFKLTDFKSAKYTIQVENNFNNEIYYSEINVVGSVGTGIAVASEYGQIFTSQLIVGYDAIIVQDQLKLIAYYNPDEHPGGKLLFKGHRTNFYKI